MKYVLWVLRNFGGLSYEDEIDTCQFIKSFAIAVIGIAFIIAFVLCVVLALIPFPLFLYAYFMDSVMLNSIFKDIAPVIISTLLYFALIYTFLSEKYKKYKYNHRNDNVVESKPSILSDVIYSIKNKACVKIDVSKYNKELNEKLWEDM
jgi:hypothetical protein